jgi:deoxyribose-phosphate aldolase
MHDPSAPQPLEVTQDAPPVNDSAAVAPGAESVTATVVDFNTLLASVQPVTRVQVEIGYERAVSIADFSALGEDVTAQAVVDLCKEAAAADPHPHAVRVSGEWVSTADQTLKALGCRDEIKITAVGKRHFPRAPLRPFDIEESEAYDPLQLPGIERTTEKVLDAEEALNAGADAFDMVLNAELILQGHEIEAVREIKDVRAAMDRTKPGAPLRVICSTAMLRAIGGSARGEDLVFIACKIVAKAAEGLPAGSIAMATETGFVAYPVITKNTDLFCATVTDVQLMKQYLPKNVPVHACGGVGVSNCNQLWIMRADSLGAGRLVSDIAAQAAINEAARAKNATKRPGTPAKESAIKPEAEPA